MSHCACQRIVHDTVGSLWVKCRQLLTLTSSFAALPFVCSHYRAMLAQSAVMRLHVVRLSVCDDRVPCSNRFEFFENNFMAE